MKELPSDAAGIRRARNQVWTGAGRYGYEPAFVSSYLYLNTIMGLSDAFHGDAALQALFAHWAGDRCESVYDSFAWLLLESEAYRRALPTRPALEELRRLFADEFLEGVEWHSRAESYGRALLCRSMQEAHWRVALGKTPGLLFPREKRLFAAMQSASALTGAALEDAVLALLRKYFGFHGVVRPLVLRSYTGSFLLWLRRMLFGSRAGTDKLLLRQEEHVEKSDGDKAERRGILKLLATDATADLAYIESCFGRPSLPPGQIAALEHELCRGGHQGCHLYFTAGDAANEPQGYEARRVAAESAQQARRNCARYAANRALYESTVRRLTERLRSALVPQRHLDGDAARWGRLDSRRAWRAVALEDERVFQQPEDAPQSEWAVELLLDASASRMNEQETIAAQGCVLAESLRRCGVAVQVESFCSLRGYTVLRTLKSWRDEDGTRRILRYSAAGWNRDALALRAAARHMEEMSGSHRRLLLVLTDASPNDSWPLNRGAMRLRRDYGGKAGVIDTAEAVRDLERQGVRCAAIFPGLDAAWHDAETIYGVRLARICDMSELAAAAGALLERELSAP